MVVDPCPVCYLEGLTIIQVLLFQVVHVHLFSTVFCTISLAIGHCIVHDLPFVLCCLLDTTCGTSITLISKISLAIMSVGKYVTVIVVAVLWETVLESFLYLIVTGIVILKIVPVHLIINLIYVLEVPVHKCV